MGEEVLEARAEVYVPAPEAADGGLGVLVVVSAKLAVLAGEFLFSHIIRFFSCYCWIPSASSIAALRLR